MVLTAYCTIYTDFHRRDERFGVISDSDATAAIARIIEAKVEQHLEAVTVTNTKTTVGSSTQQQEDQILTFIRQGVLGVPDAAQATKEVGQSEENSKDSQRRSRGRSAFGTQAAGSSGDEAIVVAPLGPNHDIGSQQPAFKFVRTKSSLSDSSG